MKKTLILFSAILLIITGSVHAADSLEFRLKLRSVNDTLSFNQDSTPDNYMEYGWKILIDTDNDSLTGNTVSAGNSSGFDLAIGVSFFKMPGSNPQTGSMLNSYTQENTMLLNGMSASYGHAIRAYIDFSDTTLVMKADKANAEIAAIQFGNRYYASTNFWSSTGMIQDVTTVSTIGNIINDPTMDVNYSFVDIKQVSTNGITGIEQNSDNAHILIYPIPNSGKFKIEIENKTTNKINIEIYNLIGEKVLEQNSTNEIDLSKSPKGIYFVKVFNGTEMYNQQIVIQ